MSPALSYVAYARIAERLAKHNTSEVKRSTGIPRATLRKIQHLFEELPKPRTVKKSFLTRHAA